MRPSLDHLCAHPPPLPPPFPPVRPDSRSASDGPLLLLYFTKLFTTCPSHPLFELKSSTKYIAALQLLGQLSHCWAEPRQLRNAIKTSS